MKAKVSIILPSLNVHEYIDQCLRSVRNQTLKEIEIICVDAGSTDGTLEIIESNCREDERIKLIKSPKKSYGLQMNLGIDRAEGKYIGIVETDDYVRSDMYEYLFNVAEQNSVDFIKADFYRFKTNENGTETLYLNKLTNDEKYYNRLINPQEEREVFKFVMNTWSGIYCKEFLVKNNIRHSETPGASFQDTDFWFQTFCHAKRTYFVDKPFYMNRRDNPNSSVYSKNKIYAFCDEYDYIYQKLLQSGIAEKYIAEFQFYRYRSYMSTLSKCDALGKKEFLQRFKKDLLDSKNKNELNLSLFTEGGKKTVDLILNHTEKFLSLQLKKKPNEYKLSTNSKETLISGKIEGNPSISIIVPVYNGEKYLRKCIESIQRQTLHGIEIIIINDGSIDNTIELAKELCRSDKRITLLSQPNLGSGQARNFGMKIAKGEYIAFMDADDWYPSETVLEKLYEKAISNKATICGGSFSNFKDGKLCSKFEGTYKKYTFEKEGFVEFKAYQFDYGYHRFIYSLKLIRDNGIYFPDLLRFQDPPFFLTAMDKAERFYAIPDIVYCYRKGENTVKWNETKIQDLLTGILFEVKYSKEKGYDKLHRIAVDHINVDFNKNIQNYLNFENIKIVELLFKINGEIDVDLLIEAGYNIERGKTYLIKPLRRFAEMFNPQIKQVIVKTGHESIVFDKSNINKCPDEYRDEVDILNKKLIFLKNTTSYKLGRAITFIPRKLIAAFKK